MNLLLMYLACGPKKADVSPVSSDPLQDIEVPVLDIEKETSILEDTVIVAGESEKKAFDALPEDVQNELLELEKDFHRFYEIPYTEDEEKNSRLLLIEKKQELLDFGERAVLLYDPAKSFEERCASAFYSGFAELRYREMGMHYPLPVEISELGKAIFFDKMDKKGVPPREGGAKLIERLINTYMRKGVKSMYADKALKVLSQFVPETYVLPSDSAGVAEYVDA